MRGRARDHAARDHFRAGRRQRQHGAKRRRGLRRAAMRLQDAPGIFVVLQACRGGDELVSSITEPPPTASRKSICSWRTCCTALIGVSKVGFGSMPANSAT